MSDSYDLGLVERITADAIGEPGDRTFFVQAAVRDETVTILVEKEQVRVLSEALQQLLAQLPDQDDEELAPLDDDLELEPPLVPSWRAGEISIEHDELTDRIVIVLTELVDDEDEDALPGRARFEMSRAQARALSEHGSEAVAAGRPRCQLCGYPMEAGGRHMCPAMNGHRSYHG